MLPILFGALGLAVAGVSGEKRMRREEEGDEEMGAVALWMGGRGPAAGTGGASWMGARAPALPYNWDTPSSVVANWSKGTVYGATAMSVGPSGDFDPDRSNFLLGMVAARARQSGIDTYPSNDPSVSAVHRPTGESSHVRQVWIQESSSSPSPSMKAVLDQVQSQVDRTSPGVYSLQVTPAPRGYFVKIYPGPSASGFGVVDLEDSDEAFGINILGLNIALTPEERLESIERKIENAKTKKEKYEKESTEEDADIEYLAKKIARLEQMIDRWEEKKEKIEVRMGASYGGIFGKTWFKDPVAQAQAESVVRWAKHVERLPGVKRSLRMRKRGYSDEQIQKGIDPYAAGQVHKAQSDFLAALQPLVTMQVQGKITPSELSDFKLWMSKKYPDVELELPTAAYGHVSRIMPNLTSAYGRESREERKERKKRQGEGHRAFRQEYREHRKAAGSGETKPLQGAFWEGTLRGVVGKDDSTEDMNEVELFAGLFEDDLSEFYEEDL